MNIVNISALQSIFERTVSQRPPDRLFPTDRVPVFHRNKNHQKNEHFGLPPVKLTRLIPLKRWQF